MQKSELTEQIGKLNLKIAKSNQELEELELKYKRKRLEIKKYKNKISGLQLELQELELNNWKIAQEQEKVERMQRKTLEKYEDINNEYYSQEKSFLNAEDPYASYIQRNIVPYND